MSIALSTARASVRQLLRDVDLSDPGPVVKGYVLDHAISNNYQLVSARVQRPLAWTTLATLAVGDADYTYSTSELNQVGLFRLASTLELVEKVSPAFLELLRQNASSETGRPVALAVTEQAPGSVGTMESTITVYPAPREADTLQGLLSTVPAPVSADADKLQLGENGLRAVEYFAAAELLAAMPADVAGRLGIDKGVAQTYQAKAEDFVVWELTRVSRQRSGRYANRSSPNW